MKFIHIPGEFPVEIEKLNYFTPSTYNGKHTIYFAFHNGGGEQWSFKNVVERDDIFEKIIIASQSQDISLITKL